MLQGIWDNWAGGANQDAANEAIRTGNPVNMGLLENFYGNKRDAENIVKKEKQDQLKSTYGSALAEVGLMVDWGEDEQSVKSKLFRTRQERAAGQENKRRAQAIQDRTAGFTQQSSLANDGYKAAALQGQLGRDAAQDQYLHSSKTQEARHAFERGENKMDRRHQSELADGSNDLQMQMSIMQSDLAEKRMDYDRETRRMDKRTAAISQLMSGLGSLGGAFSL